MEKLTKLVALVLAIVIGVGCVPMAFSEAKAAQVYAQEALPVLPEGEELGDELLSQIEGEALFATLFLLALKIATASAAKIAVATSASAAIYEGIRGGLAGNFSARRVGIAAVAGFGGGLAYGYGSRWLGVK